MAEPFLGREILLWLDAKRPPVSRVAWTVGISQNTYIGQFIYNVQIDIRDTSMSKLTFRNSQGALVDIPTVAATRFKNEFGAMFEQAALGGAVAITKHDKPKAVLLSFAEFESLVKPRAPALDDLSAQFDDLLARMQTPKAGKGMAAAFKAAPAELGRAAVKAANRKR
jgi:antitoxin Phd